MGEAKREDVFISSLNCSSRDHCYTGTTLKAVGLNPLAKSQSQASLTLG